MRDDYPDKKLLQEKGMLLKFGVSMAATLFGFGGLFAKMQPDYIETPFGKYSIFDNGTAWITIANEHGAGPKVHTLRCQELNLQVVAPVTGAVTEPNLLHDKPELLGLANPCDNAAHKIRESGATAIRVIMANMSDYRPNTPTTLPTYTQVQGIAP